MNSASDTTANDLCKGLFSVFISYISLTQQTQYFINRHFFFLAFDVDDAETARAHLIGDLFERAFADEDLPRLGVGFQSRRQIHLVADDGVFHLIVCSNGSGDRLAGADSDDDSYRVFPRRDPANAQFRHSGLISDIYFNFMSAMVR